MISEAQTPLHGWTPGILVESETGHTRYMNKKEAHEPKIHKYRYPEHKYIYIYFHSQFVMSIEFVAPGYSQIWIGTSIFNEQPFNL